MTDSLTAVKSVRKLSQAPRVGSSPIPATSASTSISNVLVNDIEANDANRSTDTIEPPTSPSTAQNVGQLLAILRSEPDTDVLVEVLKRLGQNDPFPGSGFCLALPGAIQAQIISTLVDTIVPTYWWAIRESPQREGLLSCLFNVAGFNAVFTQLKNLASSGTNTAAGHAPKTSKIRDFLEIAQLLFKGNYVVIQIWKALETSESDARRRLLIWKEFVNLISSGRVIAAIAQGEDILKQDASFKHEISWLSNGKVFAEWLGSNISEIIFSAEPRIEPSAILLSKTFSLGYQVPLISAVFSSVPQYKLESATYYTSLKSLVRAIPSHVRRQLLDCVLQWFSSTTKSSGCQDTNPPEADSNVLGISSLISALNDGAILQQPLVGFLSGPALSASLSIETRRGCIVALAAEATEAIDNFLESLIKSFGDVLFISHAPIVQQEALAQTLLLTAGRLHRSEPMAVLMTARSSHHMQGVSNRLDSSNPRARWLGMVVGTALSSLIDKKGMEMKFGAEDMETEEASWYIGLVNMNDQLGTFDDFKSFIKLQGQSQARITKKSGSGGRLLSTKNTRTVNGKPVFGPPRPPVQTEIIGERISEIFDDDDDQINDDENLKPYAKPDSDAEDSEEDATLVNRSKVKAPVYVRDLMSMLWDDKNAERFQLGLKHAATLIRRKVNFGAEVRDHVEELAQILCNLQDPFSTEDFEELRLQGLIAVLLSDVPIMAPWLSRQTFTGEYSIAQRCAMLTALGLGGRELSGLKEEDGLNPILEKTGFPSKRLPPRLDSLYLGGQNPATKRLEAATKSMEQQLIGPMAMEAAEKTTSHLNKLKIRNLSSRPAVERTKRKPAPNNLAKQFAGHFFFPLANRYQQDVAAYGGTSAFARVPILLVTLLRTLALLIHASGPAMLDISVVSVEMWDLLLSLRTTAIQDITVMQAVLFGLLTLLEINSDHRRVAEEHPKQLMQTQQWVEMVFDRTGSGGLISSTGDDNEVKVRTLAASVLVKTREIIDAYQRELIGFHLG